MNYPSHASSSVGQVANAYMGNPQALQQRTQPQNGVTPELIDLLALQKLQADKAAAARQMAMQSGQEPPTVAQGLEQSAMQSSRQEIAQKLGLPGLMNQGQNVPQAQGSQPQGAPQAPQAQGPQPMQRMAAGGLARLPSNLPQNYAGGGIIAFAGPDGSAVPMYGGAAMKGVSAGATETPDTSQNSMWENWMEALGPKAKAMVQYIANAGQPITPEVVAQVQQATGEALTPAPRGNLPNMAAHTAGPTDTETVAPVPPPKVPAPRVPAAIPAQVAPALGVAAPAAEGLPAALEKQLIAGLGADRLSAEKIGREGLQQRSEAMLGADQAALRTARQQDYETAKAAQMARDTASAPSIWDRMSTLGKHAGYGQWGQAAGDQRAMELAHEVQKAEGAKGLLGLKQASDAMALADKTKLFGEMETKGTAAGAAAAAEKKDAMDQARQLQATRETNVMHVDTTKMNNATQLAVAEKRYESLLEAASIRATAGAKDQLTANINAQIKIVGQELAEFKGKTVLTPAEKERHAAIIAKMESLQAALQAHDPRTVPPAGAAAPATGLPTQAALDAEFARRQGKK